MTARSIQLNQVQFISWIKNDKHVLRAFKEMKMACVFNPPLNGKEVHNVEGAYELEAKEFTELNQYYE